MIKAKPSMTPRDLKMIFLIAIFYSTSIYV
jgi:hypothetical protein